MQQVGIGTVRAYAQTICNYQYRIAICNGRRMGVGELGACDVPRPTSPIQKMATRKTDTVVASSIRRVSSINSGIPVNDILVIYTPSMIYDIS